MSLEPFWESLLHDHPWKYFDDVDDPLPFVFAVYLPLHKNRLLKRILEARIKKAR